MCVVEVVVGLCVVVVVRDDEKEKTERIYKKICTF